MTTVAVLLSEWPMLAASYFALLVIGIFLGLRQQQRGQKGK
jgi:hypothetical protein